MPGPPSGVTMKCLGSREQPPAFPEANMGKEQKEGCALSLRVSCESSGAVAGSPELPAWRAQALDQPFCVGIVSEAGGRPIGPHPRQQPPPSCPRTSEPLTCYWGPQRVCLCVIPVGVHC